MVKKTTNIINVNFDVQEGHQRGNLKTLFSQSYFSFSHLSMFLSVGLCVFLIDKDFDLKSLQVRSGPNQNKIKITPNLSKQMDSRPSVQLLLACHQFGDNRFWRLKQIQEKKFNCMKTNLDPCSEYK